MQYSQEHLKTMVYAEFGGGGQTECNMGKWKIENIILFTSIILMAIACLVIDQTKFSSNYCKKKKSASEASNLNHEQPGPPGLNITTMASTLKIIIVAIVEHVFNTKHLVTTNQRFTRDISLNHSLFI